MIGVLGGLSLIVGLFSLIDTSTSTSFSVTYLVIGIVLLIIYFAKEIIPETNFGRKKLMKLSFQTNTTEIGYNRRELEEELKKFITDKGNLWYLYTDFHNGISTHCTIWIENDWNNHYDFIYRDYGYDNVNATSAKEIFEILADDIICLYKPEIQKKLLGTDSAEYLVYPSFDGDYHIVPGSSRSSYDYILKNIAIYSNTSWKCRQQERANKISTSSATNIHYKQT